MAVQLIVCNRQKKRIIPSQIYKQPNFEVQASLDIFIAKRHSPYAVGIMKQLDPGANTTTDLLLRLALLLLFHCSIAKYGAHT